MDRKNILVILSLVIVVVFVFIIFKSYKIAKTRNKIDELPIIESNIEVVKIKQETRELNDDETNSFYDNFKNNVAGENINVIKEDNDGEIRPLDDNIKLENKINKIVNGSENVSKNNQAENIKEVIINEKNDENRGLEDDEVKKNINNVGGNFYKVQLIALKNRQQAEIFVEKTRKRCADILRDLRLFITEIDLDRKGIFYRVQVEKFNTKDEANNFCENYKRLSTSKDLISCIVVK